MRLVSITETRGDIRLRRYETRAGKLVCTHDGAYAPAGVTPMNVGYYFDSGAPQDRTTPPPGRRARGAPTAA